MFLYLTIKSAIIIKLYVLYFYIAVKPGLLTKYGKEIKVEKWFYRRLKKYRRRKSQMLKFLEERKRINV